MTLGISRNCADEIYIIPPGPLPKNHPLSPPEHDLALRPAQPTAAESSKERRPSREGEPGGVKLPHERPEEKLPPTVAPAMPKTGPESVQDPKIAQRLATGLSIDRAL